MRMWLVLLLLCHHHVVSLAIQLRILLGEIDAIFLVLISTVGFYFAKWWYLMRITLFLIFFCRRYIQTWHQFLNVRFKIFQLFFPVIWLLFYVFIMGGFLLLVNFI